MGTKYLDGVQQITGNYKDLGEVINFSGSLAVSSSIFSSWFDNVEWVRQMIAMSKADQNYDITIVRRDKNFAEDFGTSISSAHTSNWTVGLAGYRPHIYPESSGNPPLTGGSFKIGITNKGAAPLTKASLRIQLLGE
jgi:hypothetical protein